MPDNDITMTVFHVCKEYIRVFKSKRGRNLAFTRYCHRQYCMVYGIEPYKIRGVGGGGVYFKMGVQ